MFNNKFRLLLVGFAAILAIVLVVRVGVKRQPQTQSRDVGAVKITQATTVTAPNREDALVVVVDKNGQVWFGTNQATRDKLPTLIRDAIAKGAERKVYIKADARCSYGGVKEVLDVVRSSGVENIAFLTEDSQPKARD